MCAFRCWLVLSLIVATVSAQVPRDRYDDHSNLSIVFDQNGSRPVRTRADWNMRRQHILEGMQAAMGSLPDRSSLPDFDVQERETLEGDGFIRTTITFTVETGDRLPADLYVPDGLEENERRPAMLALHPTGPEGKRIVAGEGPRANRQYAVELAQRGYVVICPDYPSFGDYAGYDFNADRYDSGTMKGVFNHMRCVDLLQSLPHVAPDRIGVIGHSLGGHNAIFVGAFDKRLKVIVSSCGWTPFHDYYGGKLKGWMQDRYMPRIRAIYGGDPDRVPFDFYEAIAALAPRAFFSNSPVNDSNFDIAGVRKAIPKVRTIFELLDAEKNLELRTPPCAHDFPTEIRQDAYRFVDQVLEHSPTRDVSFAGELPRAEPLEPNDALDSFEIAHGFELQLVAHEPTVVDPVAAAFDEFGRLFVVEMRGYSEQAGELLGRIRLLEDVDHDGRYETSTVFADGLSWPTAIICYDGGVFVGAAPNILYLRDTDGDKRADQHDTVFAGFGTGNVQGLLNSFRWGIDNRIHGATSGAGASIRRADSDGGDTLTLRRRDFSFDPKTFGIRAESGGAQHGMCFDDWGRKYVCSNSDHLQFVMYEDRYAARNPLLAVPSPRISIAADGKQAPVFRASPVEPWRVVRTRLRVAKRARGPIEGGGTAAGYFTGATGATIYRGNAWPDDHHGLAIIADVGSNLIHRKRIEDDGLEKVAQRIETDSEFIRSKDTWFRPVQFANSPDGCLYALDMYREVIEHPKSLPPEIKQHLDLTSGRDRGRLYRIAPKDFIFKPPRKPGELQGARLVALLEDDNSWQRETAARLIFQSDVRNLIPHLRQMVRKGRTPQARIHGLYALHSKRALTAGQLVFAMNDSDARVVEHSLRLSEGFVANAKVIDRFEQLVEHPDARVRYQLAFSAGVVPAAHRRGILSALLRSADDGEWMRLAVMMSVGDDLLPMFRELASSCQSPTEHAALHTLAQLIARGRNDEQATGFVGALEQIGDSALRDGVLLSFADTSDWARRFAVQQAGNAVAKRIAIARDQIRNESQSGTRRRAISLLSLSDDESDREILLSLLRPTFGDQIQIAAVESLRDSGNESTAMSLLARWDRQTPRVRMAVEEALASKAQWRGRLIDALEAGQIDAADLSPGRMQSLLAHARGDEKQRLTAIANSIRESNRASIVAQYRRALDTPGNVAEGRRVFRKVCAACHQAEGHGHPIGPTLATLRNRGRESVVLNVFDPNREVNPQYLSYVAVTSDGKSHTGMIASETATTIELVQAENKRRVILRTDVEEFVSTGVSLMPDNLEKEISLQAMADLLAYLWSLP